MERVTSLLTLQHLADLTDHELAEVYAARAEPWLRVNFVSTIDGAAQGGDGVSKSINNEADKRVFDLLRSKADCLVVGAGTLRDEGYDVPKIPLVVVSRGAQVPESLLGAPEGRILMATVEGAEHLADTRSRLGPDNVLTLGRDELDLVALKAELAHRGWADQLCEGGPSLFGAMVAAGVVDELCHTVVPRLVGGDQMRIMTGPEVDATLRPVSLLEQDGTLLTRWLIS